MTYRTRLAIAFGNRLAVGCERIARLFDRWGDALKRCPNCGENMQYGKRCPQFRKEWE